MAIAAQRFNFLDRETNVGIKDFTQLVDNSVYTGFEDLPSASIEQIQDSGIMETMQESLNDLADMVQNNVVTETLTTAVDSAMSAISNMELPDTVRRVFNTLTNLDTKGLRDFLGDALRIGGQFLCNNLDFLKLFMLGFSLNPNILAGLLIACILSWLSRICKGFTSEETARANPQGKLNQVIPNLGTLVNPANAFKQFTNYYRDHLKASVISSLPPIIPQMYAISNILDGDIKLVINNARAGEMSSTQRNSLINELQLQLPLFPPTSREYRNILQATGDLRNTPLISVERRDNNLRYEHLNDKFGSYMKNLVKVDLEPITLLNLNNVQRELYSRMEQLRINAAAHPTLQSTPNDSFVDFDFVTILPPLSQEESDMLMTNTELSDSHRTLDLHPTTSVFLEA